MLLLFMKFSQVYSRPPGEGKRDRYVLFHRMIKQQTAIPRRETPELLHEPPPKTEGAGNAGCSLHPQPRVRK
jgi:hypothetical protein